MNKLLLLPSLIFISCHKHLAQSQLTVTKTIDTVYCKEFKECCVNSSDDNHEYLEDCEEINTKTEILYHKNNLLSISENYERIDLRYQLDLYKNFDLTNGKELKISDLVNEDGIDYLLKKCSGTIDSVIEDLIDEEYNELKREDIDDNLSMRQEFIKELESKEYSFTKNQLSNFYLKDIQNTTKLTIMYSNVIMHYASPYLLLEEISFSFNELKPYLKTSVVNRNKY